MSATALPAADFPPPPPGLNYVAAIEPSLKLLLIGTIWSAFLIPILIAMFFFSTPATRRQPIFIMNVLAVLFGLAEGGINIYNQASTTRAILTKPVSPDIDTAFACMIILVPIFAELILLFRVFAVYPLKALSWRKLLAIYTPIVAFKIARFTNDAIFIRKWVDLKKHTINPLVTGQEAWGLPNAKIEWFLQFFDTIYVSALFLARLQQSAGHKRSVGLSSEGTLAHTLSSRLRTLFWIAASNFVLPVLLNLAQLIFTFRDSSFLHGTYIFLVNTYVQIIGVLLATIWSTGTQWSEVTSRRAEGRGSMSDLKFASSLSTADAHSEKPSETVRSDEESTGPFHIKEVSLTDR
ncbi:hypothetical protein BV20DRAFT_953407 [Pilatotrama ljubarskyi]|nr:hypothetical protein BV20DRAFT_953407 [Pilatotrama ljubarskyi]